MSALGPVATKKLPGPEGGGQLQPRKKQRCMLSFEDDEEDAEGAAASAQPGGLQAATLRRFQEESKQRAEFAPPPLSAASLAAFGTTRAPAAVEAAAKRSLGQIYFAASQARGLRPYMEDRHTILSNFRPASSLAGASEDVMRNFVAVYDGHSGFKAAEEASQRLHAKLAVEPALVKLGQEGPADPAQAEALHQATREDMRAAWRRAFLALDGEVLERCRREREQDGSTAVCVVRAGTVLSCAHAGDSRAVLCRGGRAVRLTDDHKPNRPDERRRIEALGGSLEFIQCWRVAGPSFAPGSSGADNQEAAAACKRGPSGGSAPQGASSSAFLTGDDSPQGAPVRTHLSLAVSRSLGDAGLKHPVRLVESEPEVTHYDLHPDDSVLILASDGLWDVLSDQDAADCALGALAQHHARSPGGRRASEPAAKAVAGALVRAALAQRSADNITALVGLLQWD